MCTFRVPLKLFGCLFGGAVAGSLISILFHVCMFGLRSANWFAVTAVSNLIAGISGALAGGILHCRPMQRRQKILFAFVMIFWLPFIGVFGDMLLYQPIKFGYLVRRVESAQTPDEERAAFELARRWGCCWEVHLEEPPKDWLDPRDLDAAVKDPKRTLAVELEWLESKPNGVPYQARRTLTEKTNVYILFARDFKD